MYGFNILPIDSSYYQKAFLASLVALTIYYLDEKEERQRWAYNNSLVKSEQDFKTIFMSS